MIQILEKRQLMHGLNKMVKTILGYLASILIIFNGCGYAQANSNEEQLKVINRLKEFYTIYITENSKMPPDFNKIDLLKREYCTKNFILKMEAEEYDYDPFLDAQDCELAWLKMLQITVNPENKNVFDVFFGDIGSKNKIKLFMIKEKEQYKINDIIL